MSCTLADSRFITIFYQWSKESGVKEKAAAELAAAFYALARGCRLPRVTAADGGMCKSTFYMEWDSVSRGGKDLASIRVLKGVGEKAEQLFEKLEIRTVEDLLQYYPRTYDICEPPEPIGSLCMAKLAAVEGIIEKTPAVRQVKNLQLVTTSIRDHTGSLPVTWYNMPFLQKAVRSGSRYVLRGRLVYKGKRLTLEQPQIFTLGDYDALVQVMQPVYTLTKGLTNNAVQKAVKQALENEKYYHRREYLPEDIRREYELAEYSFAIRQIHFPKDMEHFLMARKRLVFEEFFLFILAMKRLREANELAKNPYPMEACEETDRFEKELPYELTGAQKRVWAEIRQDLRGRKTMNRLIQGDVGSGKTILAVLALLETANHGCQGALMVPTEVLARQHYESITSLFAQHGIHKGVTLLTGSMTAKEKRLAYESIAAHQTDIIIGTHALIQEKVVYDRLALVITDEQHRFGVKQREQLTEKGEAAHVLVMSATPIPRTLAIILYGDLDISVVDELPANRKPVRNCVVNTSYRQQAYQFIEKEAGRGHQVYVICPMVEESEQMEAENVTDYAEKLRAELSSRIRVEALHGKMKPAEKNRIMEEFERNEIQVLVSTTVVEVGVNVPNATVMMVENAERFGLAQLHQLRGRVGRGKDQSYCILVSSSDKKETMERLDILNQSNDGFFIANEDLKLRGPGDLLGIRQSGSMEFKIGDVFADAATLAQASEAVSKLLGKDAELAWEEHRELSGYLSEYMQKNLGRLNL